MADEVEVLVAGDVCLDVVAVPIPPKISAGEENWRQSGEKRIHFLPGGAMLLAEFIRAPYLDEMVEPKLKLVRERLESEGLSKKDLEEKLSAAKEGITARVRPEIEARIAGPRPVRPNDLGDSTGPMSNTEFLNIAERLRRDEIVHSLLEADKFPKTSDKEQKEKIYRVKQEHGYSGPANDKPPALEYSYPSGVRPRIVVISDTGNLFRLPKRDPELPCPWPEVVLQEHRNYSPLVIYKLQRPLPRKKAENSLWFRCRKRFGGDRIVIVGVADLRAAGSPISRGLSWERTALDIVWHLLHVPALTELRDCPNLIIRLELDGAILWQCRSVKGKNRYQAWLIYDPEGIEGTYADKIPGGMVASGSALTAALVRRLNSLSDDELKSLTRKIPQPAEVKKVPAAEAAAREILPDAERKYQEDADEKIPPVILPLIEGIRSGLAAARRLRELGYSGDERKPHYPDAAMFDTEKPEKMFAFREIPIIESSRQPDRGYWRLLDDTFEGKQALLHFAVSLLATKQVKLKDEDDKKEKPEAVARQLLARVPVAKYGGLTTYDRLEIENYRSLHAMLSEYLKTASPKRPFCVAVFGPPGAGKSFGVKEVAKSLKNLPGRKEVEELTFNLSLYRSPEELASAFHLVRDVALRRKVPLVFFDEFDTSLDGKALGWLRYFLAPMQDGEFLDRGAPHPIGQAIMIFAGGTSACHQEFLAHPGMTDQDFRSVKGPDFLSRLRAKLDIPSLNLPLPFEGVKKSAETKAALPVPGALGPASAPSASKPSRKGVGATTPRPADLPADIDTFDSLGPVEAFPSFAALRLRRAGVLGYGLGEKAPWLVRSDDSLSINPAVLRALLDMPRFPHGNRSFEALLEMSRLLDEADFTPSQLPAPGQMLLHADVDEMNRLLGTEYPFSSADRLKIAQAIHAHYIAERKRLKEFKSNNPSHKPWKQLSRDDRTSNEEQADSIPAKLRLVGLWFCKADSAPGQAGKVALSHQQVELLAQVEHARWVFDKRRRGHICGATKDSALRTHPCIVPWHDARLTDSEKNKDRATVRAIPRFLKAAGYIIVGP